SITRNIKRGASSHSHKLAIAVVGIEPNVSQTVAKIDHEMHIGSTGEGKASAYARAVDSTVQCVRTTQREPRILRDAGGGGIVGCSQTGNHRGVTADGGSIQDEMASHQIGRIERENVPMIENFILCFRSAVDCQLHSPLAVAGRGNRGAACRFAFIDFPAVRISSAGIYFVAEEIFVVMS